MSPLACCKDCPSEFDCVEEGCRKIKAGVNFIMGGNRLPVDEGTRFCKCGKYPHTAECVATTERGNA